MAEDKKYDFSHVSDDELDKKIAAKKAELAPKFDFSHMSDSDLDAAIQSKINGPSFVDNALSKAAEFGNTVNSYSDAPAMAAFSELTRTKPEFNKDKPSIIGNVKAAFEAGKNQFGADTSLAPTGKDVMIKNFGVSDATQNMPIKKFANELLPADKELIAKNNLKPDISGAYTLGTKQTGSLADVAGMAADLAVSPWNAVPVGTIFKGLGLGAEKLFGLGAKAAFKLPGAEVAAKATGKIIGDFVKGPQLAKDLEDLKTIAAKNGIDLSKAPDAIEFGKNSVIARGGRNLAETLGPERIDAHNAFLGDVSTALENKNAQISGGPPLSRTEAGVHIKDSFDRAQKALYDTADVRYSTITNDYPGLMLSEKSIGSLKSKIGEMKDYAKDLASTGLTNDIIMGKELNSVADALKNNQMSFAQINRFREGIGKKAFEVGNRAGQVESDISKLRDLYGSVSDALIDTVRTSVKDGEAVAGALQIDNGLISDFIKKKSVVDDILANPKLGAENVFDRMTKNTKQIESLKAILAPEDFNKLKGAWLEAQIKRDEYGNISFQQLRNSLKSRQNSEVAAHLFDPAEMKDILDVAHLGDRVGPPILSSSGTGPSNFFKDLGRNARQSVVNESALDILKNKARANALKLPVAQPAIAAPINLFGPRAISLPEAAGIRLPQQISTQQRNKR